MTFIGASMPAGWENNVLDRRDRATIDLSYINIQSCQNTGNSMPSAKQ